MGRKCTHYYCKPVLGGGEAGFPIIGEMALEFSKGHDFVSVTENCFKTEFAKAAKQLNIHIDDGFDAYNGLPDELYDKFYDFGCGHKLLGRPCFVQEDYRDDESSDVLLLQIDSAYSDSGEEDSNHFIIFGDAGAAGFFIDREDLKNLDFSNITYDWACC